MNTMHVIEYIKTDNFIKYFIICTFIFILTELSIILIIPSSHGYELSIYGAYPIFFWILFFTSLIFCEISFFHAFFFRSKYWIYGFTGLLINYSILLFLPIIRGYYFFALGNDDIFAHLAWTNVVIKTGTFYNLDIYPGSHAMLSFLSIISGIPIETISNYLPGIFSLFFIIFCYVLTKSLSSDLRMPIIFLMVGSPLLFSTFHYTFHPFIFSLLLLPLFLYSLFKIIDNKLLNVHIILAFILIVMCLLYHPLTFVIWVIILVSLYALSLFINYKKGVVLEGKIFYLIIFSGVTFAAWYTYFYYILYEIKRFTNVIFLDTPEATIITSYSDRVSSSGANFSLILTTFLKMYGAISIYVLIGCVCIGYLFYVYALKKEKPDIYLIFFGMNFLIAIIFGIFVLSIFSVVFEPVRAIGFAIVIVIIFISITLSLISQKNISSKLFIVMFLLIIISLIIGALNIYDSPWTSASGKQMSHFDKNGIDWFLQNKDTVTPIFQNFNRYSKYEMFYFGPSEINENVGNYVHDQIPSHFGYEDNAHLSKTLGVADAYVITFERMSQIPYAVSEDRRYRQSFYSNDDYFRLKTDSTIEKIYDNREYEVWRLH